MYVSIQIHAQDTENIWQWIEQLGGPGWDISNGIVVDQKDNIYVAGGFTTSLEGDGESIESEGNRDVYAARFTNEGKLEWLWQAGGLYMDKITAIKDAPDNDLYVAGLIEGELKFGKKKIEGDGNKIFVSRINKRGKSDWVEILPYTGSASGYLLETDKDGNILLGGVFSDSLSCEETQLYTNGHTDMFLLRLNSEGEFDELKQFGEKGKERLTAMATDSLGNIYCSAKYNREFSLEDISVSTVTDSKNGNNLLFQLDSTLISLWSKTFSSESYAEINGLVCDNDNHLLMTGNFNHVLYVDTIEYETNGLNDFFVASVDSVGDILWLHTYGSKYNDCSNDITLNKLGGGMISGSFSDTLHLDSLQLVSNSAYPDAFIAQLDTIGTITWAGTLEGNQGNRAVGSTIDSQGNLFLTGAFNGQLDAGTTTLESKGEDDVYVAKYYNCPTVSNAIKAPDYLCEGDTVTLSVDDSYSNIVWNDSIYDFTEYKATEAGAYYVSMVSEKGCVVKDTITLTEALAQLFSIGLDTALLVTQTIDLSGPDNAYTYKWQDGSIFQTYTAFCEDNEAGTYSYELTITDTLGCEWSDEANIEFYEQVDYADLTEGESLIKIYPNPVSTSFIWSFETAEEVQMSIELRDGSGKLLYSKDISRYSSGEQNDVDMSGYISGIYYFSIISNDDRITKKVVKQ